MKIKRYYVKALLGPILAKYDNLDRTWGPRYARSALEQVSITGHGATGLTGHGEPPRAMWLHGVGKIKVYGKSHGPRGHGPRAPRESHGPRGFTDSSSWGSGPRRAHSSRPLLASAQARARARQGSVAGRPEAYRKPTRSPLGQAWHCRDYVTRARSPR